MKTAVIFILLILGIAALASACPTPSAFFPDNPIKSPFSSFTGPPGPGRQFGGINTGHIDLGQTFNAETTRSHRLRFIEVSLWKPPSIPTLGPLYMHIYETTADHRITGSPLATAFYNGDLIQEIYRPGVVARFNFRPHLRLRAGKEYCFVITSPEYAGGPWHYCTLGTPTNEYGYVNYVYQGSQAGDPHSEYTLWFKAYGRPDFTLSPFSHT